MKNFVSSYLLRSFMSHSYKNYEDPMKDDKPGNVFCLIAVDYQSFLSLELHTTDKHLKIRGSSSRGPAKIVFFRRETWIFQALE